MTLHGSKELAGICHFSDMASSTRYLSSFTRSVTAPFIQSIRPNAAALSSLYPFQQQSRDASTKSRVKETKQKKKRKTYKEYDMKELIQFNLCDAMRFV